MKILNYIFIVYKSLFMSVELCIFSPQENTLLPHFLLLWVKPEIIPGFVGIQETVHHCCYVIVLGCAKAR
jgi:hypothetical protein